MLQDYLAAPFPSSCLFLRQWKSVASRDAFSIQISIEKECSVHGTDPNQILLGGLSLLIRSEDSPVTTQGFVTVLESSKRIIWT